MQKKYSEQMPAIRAFPKNTKIKSATNTPYTNQSLNSKRIQSQHLDKYMREQISELANCQQLASKSQLDPLSNKQQKQSIQKNILNKLLLPPHKKQPFAKKQNFQSDSSSVLNKPGKKFQQRKPDVENLIQENVCLKKEIHQLNKTVLNNQVRQKQFEKKVKKLEERKAEVGNFIIDQIQNDKNIHVLVDILRKKLHDVQVKLINAEDEIKRLRKLPNVSIFQEGNIEKQHYLAEAIRLKAVLTSYENNQRHSEMSYGISETNFPTNSSANNPLSQEFLQMLKQENQKLKATIRLQQNQKVLMKSHNKLYKDKLHHMNKELDGLKQKILFKESEIEKLVIENKNLLFKKATQLKLEQQTTQNKLIKDLQKKLEISEIKLKKLEEQNQFLVEDNAIIKEKQKNKAIQLTEKENKYESMKLELLELESRYQERIRSLQIGKMPANDLNKNMRISSRPLKNEGHFQKNGISSINKEIKFKDIKPSLVKLYFLHSTHEIDSYDDIFKLYITNQLKQMKRDPCVNTGIRGRTESLGNKLFSFNNIDESSKTTNKNINQSTQIITYSHMIRVLQSFPISLSSYESSRLASYIFNDYSDIIINDQEQVNNKMPVKISSERVMNKSLIINILKASINKLTECLNNETVINSWKCLLAKNRRFLTALQRLNEDESTEEKKSMDRQFLSVDDFVSILSQYKRQEITEQEIDFMVLMSFSDKKSKGQLMMERQKILEVLYWLNQAKNATIFGQNRGSKLRKQTQEQKMLEKDLENFLVVNAEQQNLYNPLNSIEQQSQMGIQLKLKDTFSEKQIENPNITPSQGQCIAQDEQSDDDSPNNKLDLLQHPEPTSSYLQSEEEQKNNSFDDNDKDSEIPSSKQTNSINSSQKKPNLFINEIYPIADDEVHSTSNLHHQQSSSEQGQESKAADESEDLEQDSSDLEFSENTNEFYDSNEESYKQNQQYEEQEDISLDRVNRRRRYDHE